MPPLLPRPGSNPEAGNCPGKSKAPLVKERPTYQRGGSGRRLVPISGVMCVLADAHRGREGVVLDKCGDATFFHACRQARLHKRRGQERATDAQACSRLMIWSIPVIIITLRERGYDKAMGGPKIPQPAGSPPIAALNTRLSGPSPATARVDQVLRTPPAKLALHRLLQELMRCCGHRQQGLPSRTLPFCLQAIVSRLLVHDSWGSR